VNTHLTNGSSASVPSGDWEAIRHDALARDGFRCVECHSGEAETVLHVHHLLSRSMGGSDELGNLITLCAGCHAARHPKLSGHLARGLLERWASRLAHWLDREGVICEDTRNFGPALRLFGLDRFRDGQLPIVEAALAGQSVLAVSPTGFGKTLCFQLPAVLRANLSLVLSPLKALMAEQVSSLLRRKVPSTYINSDLSTEEKDLRYRLVSKNGFKLLYVAPERFFVRSQKELAALHDLRPAFLVIDEAHCVDQWGRDFRPEYGRIGEIRRALGSPPVLAFTATAGMEMQRRILTSLGVPNATVFVRGVNRPNIALLRWKAPIASRGEVITQICRAIPCSAGKMMIFVPTVKVGTALQKELAEKARPSILSFQAGHGLGT
jgi:ATP-dependent DNA helicase RecQ